MAQNGSLLSVGASAGVPKRISRGWLAGMAVLGLCGSMTGPAWAQDLQITTSRDGDLWTRTVRTIPARNYGIKGVPDGGAPGNRCSIPAFEVLNPARGEFRCVGYILPD